LFLNFIYLFIKIDLNKLNFNFLDIKINHLELKKMRYLIVLLAIASLLNNIHCYDMLIDDLSSIDSKPGIDDLERIKKYDEDIQRAAIDLASSASKYKKSLQLNKNQKEEEKEVGGLKNGKCEPISVPMCQDMKYNLTSMPNQFNHESQEEAAIEINQFWALVEIGCSADLKFFLCSLYTPICISNYEKPVRACKSVCIRARQGCEPYMKKFGFNWPVHMNCDTFPEYPTAATITDDEICMDPIDATQEDIQDANSKFSISQPIAPNNDNDNVKNEIKNFVKNKIEQNSVACPFPLIEVKSNDARFNKISTGGIMNCVQSCQASFFNHWQLVFSNRWLFFWTIVCLLSSTVTVLSFIIGRKRQFQYPEKSVFYLFVCYLFISSGYIIKFIAGYQNITCERDQTVRTEGSKLEGKF
jgi:frizzled 5/8